MSLTSHFKQPSVAFLVFLLLATSCMTFKTIPTPNLELNGNGSLVPGKSYLFALRNGTEVILKFRVVENGQILGENTRIRFRNQNGKIGNWTDSNTPVPIPDVVGVEQSKLAVGWTLLGLLCLYWVIWGAAVGYP